MNNVGNFLAIAVAAFALGFAIALFGPPQLVYVDHGRVCISVRLTVDPCITRRIPNAQQIADAINQAVGREWRGLP